MAVLSSENSLSESISLSAWVKQRRDVDAFSWAKYGAYTHLLLLSGMGSMEKHSSLFANTGESSLPAGSSMNPGSAGQMRFDGTED